MESMRTAPTPERPPFFERHVVRVVLGIAIAMTLLGGAGTFFGPFVGAATYLVLADRLSLVLEAWPLVIGAIFMGFVLFLPRGIWGTFLEGLGIR